MTALLVLSYAKFPFPVFWVFTEYSLIDGSAACNLLADTELLVPYLRLPVELSFSYLLYFFCRELHETLSGRCFQFLPASLARLQPSFWVYNPCACDLYFHISCTVFFCPCSGNIWYTTSKLTKSEILLDFGPQMLHIVTNPIFISPTYRSAFSASSRIWSTEIWTFLYLRKTLHCLTGMSTLISSMTSCVVHVSSKSRT